MDAEVTFFAMGFSLLAASLGLAGSIILYTNSVTVLQFPFYGNHELIKQVQATNERLKKWQRRGFGLLCVSFVLQILGALAPLAPALTLLSGS